MALWHSARYTFTEFFFRHVEGIKPDNGMSHQSFFRHAFDSGGHMSASALCRALSRGILLACVLALLIPTHLAASQSATPVVPDAVVTETPAPQLTVDPESTPRPIGFPESLPGVSPHAVGDLTLSIVCKPDEPIIVPRGGTTSFECHFDALLGASLLGGLIEIRAQIDASTSSDSATITLQSNAPRCDTTTSALSICLSGLSRAQLLSQSKFTVTITQPCPDVNEPAQYGITISSSTQVIVRLIVPLINIVLPTDPVTILAAPSDPVPLSASATAQGTRFRTSNWTGSSYSQSALEEPLHIAISPPSTGCLAPGSSVSISGGKQLTHLADDTVAIPNSAISITSVSDISDPLIDWGQVIDASGPNASLNASHLIFQTGDATEADGNAAVTVDLTLTPPNDASPGDYEGTIVITSSIDGPEN